MLWHRALTRPVLDLNVKEIELVQYRCADPGCGASQTVSPPGIGRKCRQSDRTKALSVVLWGLGLSYEDVERVMKGLGVPMTDVGVLKNVRAMGAEAMKRAKAQASRPVLGADELESYEPAAEKAGLEHQLCLAHWRKAVARRLKKIEGYRKEKELIREALKQLDEAALAAIRWLHQQFRQARAPRKGEKQSPEYALRMLTLDIIENWNRLVCYQQTHEPLRDNLGRKVPRDYQVPSTNNATENAIGRGGKIRAKRMRGFKRLDTVLAIMYLLASLGAVLAWVPFQSLLTCRPGITTQGSLSVSKTLPQHASIPASPRWVRIYDWAAKCRSRSRGCEMWRGNARPPGVFRAVDGPQRASR